MIQRTSQNMTYPQATLPTLEALYRLGIQVCDEIEKFQPDVVIGLVHSGWMPVVVAQALWAETRESPFPPSMRTNIGLEKHELYVARYGKSIPAFCCGECSDEPGRKGHYLAWVAEQCRWLKTLRKQVKEVFSSTPKRILVVDDIFGGYRSGYATLALLETLYPKVETYVYAGRNDLTDNFVAGWLDQFAPALAAEIPPENETSSSKRYRSPWLEKLKPLITGTEDITPDRLDWKFISRASPAIQALAGHVPEDVALAAPEWAKSLACSYALQRLKDEIKKDEIIEPGEDDGHLWPITRLSLSPRSRLASRAWRQGGVTNADIALVYGDSPEKFQEGLEEVNVKYEWQIQGEGENVHYFPMISFESWERTSDDPVRGFAEFIPGEVWAGMYPVPSNAHTGADFLKDLLSTGANSFIDLTNSQDVHRAWPYREMLLQTGQEIGRKVEIKAFPLPFQASPKRTQVERVLNQVAQSLKKGQRIYIYAGYQLEGRVPLILACLLMQRGYPAKKALTKVNAFWMKTLPFLIRTPMSEAQQKFILDW